MGNCFSEEKKGKNESTPKTGTGKTKTEQGIGHQNSQPAKGIQGSSSLLPTSLYPPEQQDEQKNSMPTNAYLLQPHTPPENKLCAFYAYYHYTNGKINKEEFEAKVIEVYKNEYGNEELAKEVYFDGNDPGIFIKFSLTETTDYNKALNGDKLIVADIPGQHFYAMIKSKNTWWNYDSYHQKTPSKIGDFEQALAYLKKKGQQVWIS